MRKFNGLFITLVVLAMGLVFGACQSTAPATPEATATPEVVLSLQEMGEALFEAVKSDDVPEVKRLLETGADPNVETTAGYVLFLAANKGNVDVVKLLIEHGADTNVQDLWGGMPIGGAVQFGHLEVFELLLDRVVDVNSRDGRGASLLDHAARDNRAKMVELLIARGADVDSAYEGWRALHVAAFNNSLETSKLLVEAGARLGLVDNGGKTPLDVAVEQSSDEVAQFLREAGAE